MTPPKPVEHGRFRVTFDDDGGLTIAHEGMRVSLASRLTSTGEPAMIYVEPYAYASGQRITFESVPTKSDRHPVIALYLVADKP